ncbi:MAG: ABC transporter ATP-binding protein [Lachnospiraceae bacterium]|nr:ABC transporter ATP-binding protein [Lachnospiraceae bacterium]
MLGNLKFHLLSAKKWNAKLFYFQFIKVIPDLIAISLSAYLPAGLVEGLEQKWDMKQLILYVLLCATIIWACNLLGGSMYQYLYRNSMSLTMYYDMLCFEKMMKIDYDLLEGKEESKIIGNTWNTLRNEYSIRNSVTGLPALITAGIGSLWYGAVLLGISPWIVLLLMGTVLFSSLLLKKVRKFHEEYSKKLYDSAKEIAYINRQAMERSAGKDIRIYQMQKWLLSRYHGALEKQDKIYHAIHKKYFERTVLETLMAYVTEVLSCGYFVWLLYRGELSVSQLVLYMNLVLLFSGQFSGLIHGIADLNVINTAIINIRTFLALPEQDRWGKGVGKEALEKLLSSGVEITFDHVSFGYGKQPVLDDFNLTICAGEKLALIGLNGAGKTTVVKLLCGFYAPQKGEIRMNGIPQRAFSREEYESLVSVLFQDSIVVPLSVDQNLTGEKQPDHRRLADAMELADFDTKYHSLPKKGATMLVREANENATDFSGGEFQKLLFARALYKKAPMLILDEPTAALDPIAESRLYERYAKAAKGRTSVYISHRLSSTRFCDRIVLLEDAKIREVGTHEELMNLQGRYAELFEMQSKYYKQDVGVKQFE